VTDFQEFVANPIYSKGRREALISEWEETLRRIKNNKEKGEQQDEEWVNKTLESIALGIKELQASTDRLNAKIAAVAKEEKEKGREMRDDLHDLNMEIQGERATLDCRQLVFKLEMVCKRNALKGVKHSVATRTAPWTFQHVVYEMQKKHGWKLQLSGVDLDRWRNVSRPNAEINAWETYLMRLFPGQSIKAICLDILWPLSMWKTQGSGWIKSFIEPYDIEVAMDYMTEHIKDLTTRKSNSEPGEHFRDSSVWPEIQPNISQEIQDTEQRLSLAKIAYKMAFDCGLFRRGHTHVRRRRSY
jgi:hypothetical protein